MTDANDNLPARYANGRFGPANSGRPVGSYSRASRRAALAILEHFEANHEDLLQRVSADSSRYVKLLALVLPRKIEIGPADAHHMSDSEVARAFAVARDLVENPGDQRAALAELQAVLVGESAPGHR